MLFCSWYPAVMLAFEAGSVIDMWLRKIARGGAQGATEGRLMVMEKVDALFEAGSLLVGGGSAAELVEMYRRHVAANARLGHARALTDGKSRK